MGEQEALRDEEGKPLSKQAEARELYASRGGALPPQEFAEQLLDDGFFPQEQQRKWHLQGAVIWVRGALGAHDATGKPFAGPMGSQDEAWAQRSFWPLDTYKHNIDTHVKQGIGNLETARLLADECQIRYGERPAIPAVVMP